MPTSIDFLRVSFSFDSLAAPLLRDVTVRFPPGWTGIVGPNGAGKTTVLQLAVGELTPDSGSVIAPRRVACCPQRTDEPPSGLARWLLATDSDACALRGRMGVAPDWLARWDTLSHGERKRAQVGVALAARPDVLAVDEPTNHLDSAARALLVRELRTFAGIGLLVSHDRELLDQLCDRCLFLSPPNATLRPGGYSDGSAQARSEAECLRAERRRALRELQRIEAEAARRRETAAREHKLRSKRGLARHDRDGRAKINLARVTDSKAGAPLRQLDGRRAQAAQRVANIVVAKRVEPGLWLPASRARVDAVLREPPGEVPFAACAADAIASNDLMALAPGAPDALAPETANALALKAPEAFAPKTPQGLAPDAVRALPPQSASPRLSGATSEGGVLRHPRLEIGPAERVAVVGPNGAGKSTLIRRLLPRIRVAAERLLYMPQELSVEQTRQLIRDTRALPRAALGRIMQTVAGLGSDPRRLLETDLPSPGEARKLLLAFGAARDVQVLIMDEPTNHLDLPSIECVEAVLRDFPGALLLVSHDRRFLDALTTTEWRVEREPGCDAHVVVCPRSGTPAHDTTFRAE